MNKNKDAHIAAKALSKSRLRYMAHYGGEKPLICQIRGQRIVEIYRGRGFVEIDKAEFNRLVEIVKARNET